MVGMWKTQAIRAAVELGVFESLPASARDIERSLELADSVGIRLMRALAELGLVRRDEGGRLTTSLKRAPAATLTSSFPLRMLPHYGAARPMRHGPRRSIPCRRGNPHSGSCTASNLFERLQRQTGAAALLPQGLRQLRPARLPDIGAAFDFGVHDHILDAGGGTGELAFALLRAYPDMTAAVMDLPEVIREAEPPDNLKGRCRFAAGDFFEQWPVRSDAVVLARVLHDWSDEDAVRILDRAREVMPTGGTLYVIEMVLDDDTGAGGLLDLNMLIVAGGAERTEEAVRGPAGQGRVRAPRGGSHPFREFGHQGEGGLTAPDAVASILERVCAIPGGADVSLIIRHAEREDIPEGTFGYDVNLTAEGTQAAEELGAALSRMRAPIVLSSPVPRCVQTARAILRGAGSPAEVVTDRRLGDPGAFVVDAEAAGPLFLDLPAPEIARRQLQGGTTLPGMRPTPEGVEILLDLVASPLKKKGRLYMFVTHDIILSVFVASIFRLSLEETEWPGYLDGLLLWRSDEQLHLSWREPRTTLLQPGGQVSLPWVRRPDG